MLFYKLAKFCLQITAAAAVMLLAAGLCLLLFPMATLTVLFCGLGGVLVIGSAYILISMAYAAAK